MPIIINGKSGCAGAWWSKHLENLVKNDRVRIVEFSGLTADTVREAFREMEGLAAGTKCENYFYQANINPREDEHLTEQQWREAVDRLEANLGLTGQPRFVVEHEKHGRAHRHIIWSRIDQERGVAISDSLTAPIHERTSRELEIRFDLERGVSVLTANREQPRPERRPRKSETFRASETGIDPQTVRAELKALWQSADNGQSFKAALEQSGDYVLARGDRRDFVVIDRAGDDHGLARRLSVKVADVRARMADIDPAMLPSVEQARALQQERHRQPDRQQQAGPQQVENFDRDAANAEWENKLNAAAIAQSEAKAAQEARQQTAQKETTSEAPGAARGRYASLQTPEPAAEPKLSTTAKIRTAWRESYNPDPVADPVALAKALMTQGIGLARVAAADIEAGKRPGKDRSRMKLREGEIVAVAGRGKIYRFTQRTTGDERTAIEGRLAGLNPAELASVATAQEAMRAVSRAAWLDKKIAERAEAQKEAPLGKTAGDIRTALQTSRTASELEDAFAARGISLAEVSATEAEVSRQEAARYRDAKRATARGRYAEMKGDPGRYAPELAEGEIVAVDGRGGIYRLDGRTTGHAPAEIEGHLAGIDRAALMNVADTQEVMRAASWAAWRADRQAEREQARSASWVEQRIAACATDAPAVAVRDAEGRTVTGAAAVSDQLKAEGERTYEAKIVRGAEAFAARLDEAGIAIARVTAADCAALDALRRDEHMKQLAAEANGETYKGNRFAEVLAGDLAAVSRNGDVYRINPAKLGDAERYIPAELPGVIEARDHFAAERADKATIWELHRAGIDTEQAQQAADRQLSRAATTAEHAVHDTFDVSASAIGTGLRNTGRISGRVMKAFETAFGMVFGWAMGPPKLTPQQVRDQAKAHSNEETLHAEAYAAHLQAKETAHDWAMHALKTGQQQEDLKFSERFGTPPTREANIGRERDDDYERERER